MTIEVFLDFLLGVGVVTLLIILVVLIVGVLSIPFIVTLSLTEPEEFNEAIEKIKGVVFK